MGKRGKNIAIAALAAVLAAALIWGVAENVRHRRYRLQLQAMYERSFFQLVGEMDDLEVKLGKLAVSDGARQDVILLSEVYRQADGAGRELAALPADHESMEEVLAFVNRLSEFSGALAQKVAKGQVITAEEEGQLASLLARCKELNYAVQSLRAEDVADAALESAAPPPDGSPDPYAEFAEPSTPVPSLIYDGAFSQAARTPPKGLGEKAVDEEEAIRIARAYVGETRVRDAQAEQGVEGEIPCYGVLVDTADDGALHLQVTRTGGHVLMMVPEFSPGETNFDVESCRGKAMEFLRLRGYGETEPAYYQVNFGLATFNFVPVQGGVRLYPDLIKVQVSLESGEIVGVEANNYLRNHTARDLPAATLTEEEALALAPSLQDASARLALIPRFGREILCYELSGTAEGESYLVYLNAQSGEAEEILQVVADEEGEAVV